MKTNENRMSEINELDELLSSSDSKNSSLDDKTRGAKFKEETKRQFDQSIKETGMTFDDEDDSVKDGENE